MLRLRRQLPATHCVSEAATNVVQHAYNEHHRGAIELEVYETAAHLIIQITDTGAGTEDTLQPGTGLRIVSQVASAQITNSHTGTTLTMSFPCAPLA
jgi:anti-sigma regulatory factor (Ser/Thr protein kinase)